MVEQPSLPHPDLRALFSARLSANSLVRAREPLAKKTTLRVGGRADLYIEPASEEDLAIALKISQEENLPVMFLGRGSNLLIRDGGIRGLVISLAQPTFTSVRIEGMRLHCGAGARLKKVATEARSAGIGGLEFLEGIPGSVGGALRMNAGAMGAAIFDVVINVRYMDLRGQILDRAAAEIEKGYRHCDLFRTHIVLAAIFEGRSEPREIIERKMAECSRKRWDSQPSAPSAGCIFKNNVTIPSGKLIQELGLKGTRVGRAVVSDIHGNFIVNEGGATAREVLDLIEIIKAKALVERGIALQTEVEIVGEDT